MLFLVVDYVAIGLGRRGGSISCFSGIRYMHYGR